MPKKIIDSNFLHHPYLVEYLEASSHNYAVLTDYIFIEAYKNDDPTAINQAMRTLARYPKQVLLLKPTSIICGLSGRSSGLARRMLLPNSFKSFETLCENLIYAEQGNPIARQFILGHRAAAREHMRIMLEEARTLPEDIAKHASIYTPNELKSIRKSETYNQTLTKKIVQSITIYASESYRRHPYVKNRPKDINTMLNTYIYRYAVASYLFALKRISKGAIEGRAEDIANDMVDITFAAHGTYFDDLLTEDKKLAHLYSDTCFILANLKKNAPK